ncbi:leucyl aminopeptidase [Actinomyces haliotis]|uniref:leucyl aminopeptidase n=1 Tax=Actinomyces haliotis TaxID=1280843 RepID=UPI002B2767D4|nr:leucyl aminopeptidase [Actinomyces haliotis]
MTGNPVPADINLLAPGSAPEAEVLVLAASQGAVLLDGQTGVAATEALAAILPSLGARGSLDELVRVPAAAVGGADAPVIAVVGAGTALDTDDERDDEAALGATRPAVLARLAGRAVRGLAGTGTVVLGLPASTREELAAVAEGALTAAYAWAGRVPTDTAPVATVEILTPLAGTAEGEAVLARARALATATTLARDLVNAPPNRLTPQALAERAREVAEEAGLVYDVLDEVQLADQGFGGIVGVGQGSVHPPRLVRVEWVPEAADARSVALIGKGITFDSGGLSLKPPASMPEMKSDMAGAATVLATVLAASLERVPVRVTGWLALAENMPGADAQRPSDVVAMYGGTTVEITNTDAEGRLVMADALARAVEEDPDAVLDVATLTGAQIVALGERVSGVMGTPSLRDEVVASAVAAGEAFWPMPLPRHLRANLDSPFADLRNAAVGNRAGGMLVAGLFLREFVGSTPWAHLDVAGPAYNEHSPWGGTPTGGTGVGVATLLELIRRRA